MSDTAAQHTGVLRLPNSRNCNVNPGRKPCKPAAALKEQKSQDALHLTEQMENLHREVELELTVDREKNQLLLQQYQRDSTMLQKKLEERELVTCRCEAGRRRGGGGDTSRAAPNSRWRYSRAEAELQLENERNAEFQEEVLLLQETVRRECEERAELTPALSHAQAEVLALRSPASHQGFSVSPPNPTEGQSPPREHACPSPKLNPRSSLLLFELAKHTATLGSLHGQRRRPGHRWRRSRVECGVSKWRGKKGGRRHCPD
ncbi:uncharacterized protein lekr1 isoform 1-T1 [Spinachia spinachia]